MKFIATLFTGILMLVTSAYSSVSNSVSELTHGDSATTTAEAQPIQPVVSTTANNVHVTSAVRASSKNSAITTATAASVPTAKVAAPTISAAPPISTITHITSPNTMQAHELVTPDAYLNTDGQPITLAQYRGKNVVLLEFWTYTCINCQRTLPYIVSWYAKYKDQGLVVIGVHTPEFSYEHLESNVAAALKTNGITYPVVLDNEYQTWNAYGNQFWPHTYVIDVNGNIVHDHIGEGGYDDTEKAIQTALAGIK